MSIHWSTILFMLVFIECQANDSIDHLCNYTIKKVDETFDACLSNQCNRFLDNGKSKLDTNNNVSEYDFRTEKIILHVSSTKRIIRFFVNNWFNHNRDNSDNDTLQNIINIFVLSDISNVIFHTEAMVKDVTSVY